MDVVRYLKFFAFLLFFVSVNTNVLGSVVKTHPRLLNVNVLGNPDYQKTIDKMRSRANRMLNQDVFVLWKVEKRRLTNIRLFSILSFSDHNRDYFERARDFVAMIPLPGKDSDDQLIRWHLQALAYYYDFCFSLLDLDSKQQIEKKIILHLQWLEDEGFLDSDNFGGGHEHYANVSAIIAGLALYHESDYAHDLIPKLIKNFKNGFWPFYKYFAGEDGGMPPGWEYSRIFAFLETEMFAVWKNATGEDFFKKNQWLKNSVQYFGYGLRGDLTYWPVGDIRSNKLRWRDRVFFKKMALVYGDDSAIELALKVEKNYKKNPGNDELFYQLLWETERAIGASKKRWVDFKSFERSGIYVYRDSLESSGVSILFKNSPNFLYNHSHRDANSFLIWYKEDLALDSGVYDRYDSEHWWNYYTRSIAHNTVLIKDPNEVFERFGKRLVNDGGQRYLYKKHYQPFNVQDLESGDFKIGDNQVLVNNEDYLYIVGDATKSYSSQKCELFKRHFIVLKNIDGWSKPVIIIYDDLVSTDKSFKKTWVMHSVGKPYLQGSVVTTRNGGAKLRQYVVGAKKYDFKFIGGLDGKEYGVGEQSFNPKDQNFIEKSGWRVEISPKKTEMQTEFLNILVVSDRRDEAMPLIEETEKGFRINNWLIEVEDDAVTLLEIKN